MVFYRIERKNDVRTRGSSSKPTESERSFTIEAVGGRGSAAGADKNFRAWLAANAPTDAFGNPIAEDGVELEENEESLRRLWTARVRYERPAESEETKDETEDKGETAPPFGMSLASFSTSGGTATIRRSLATIAHPIAGTAPDYGGGIGWNGEEFEGCEIVAPKFSFELSAVAPKGFEANFGAFADAISNLTGTTNATRFLGFLPGTVLFLGVTQGTASETDGKRVWTLNYAFAAAPHATLNVGGVAVFKPGWAYLWTLTEKSFDSKRNVVVPVVRAVYVEQTYPAADFGALARLVSIPG